MAKKEERSFQYKKRTKDDLKERANMKGGNYDTYIKPKFKQWKPKDGKNVVRILPPTWDDARHYGFDIFVNFNIGADNQAYLSLSKHQKGDDPIAEARREAQQEGDKDLAKALNCSQRILYWIIDRNDEDEGPLLWAAPFTFDKSLSNLCIDEDTKEVIFIDSPDNGRDVRFYKEGTGLTTKYDPSKMKVLGPTNIAEDEGLENDWLDFIAENPLPEVLNFYDYDHIKATFDGQVGSRDDDDDDKPMRKRNKSNGADDDKLKNKNSTRRASTDDDEVVDEPKPRHRGPRHDQELDDDAVLAEPKHTRRRAVADDDDAPTEKPARARSRSRVAEEEDDEPELPLTKSRRGNDDDGGGNLREKLAARRRSRSTDDDD